MYPGVEVPAQPPPWPPGAPVVVVVGALVAFKRIELALEAVALARIAVPSLQLRIVGDALDEHGAALSRRLRARAAQPDLAGAVRFTGPVDDVGPELGRASCLLHCADREPFGLVVAEALAHGRPVVVPDTGGAAEIADLECAVLYRAGNADAAAAGVVSLVADGERAQALGAAGRARVTQRFGRERMRREFARVLTPPTRAAPATDAPLALVTVSFNSARPLLALLDSVARHLPGVRVIVVDCGSVDDSAAVAEAHPVAVSVAAGSNLGFGRGSNLGLTHVSEPVTVFVNPDVELLDDSLRSLAAAALAPGFERRLLAPLVLSSDGSRQDTVHPRPGAAAELARLALPPRLVPGPLGAALAPWRSRRPTRGRLGGRLRARGENRDVAGARAVLGSIFIYGEDLELGLRAAGAGVETWFWPAARVLHHRAHATAAAYGGEPFEVLARARHRAIAMTLGEHAACADDRRQAALFGSRALIKRALGRDPAVSSRSCEPSDGAEGSGSSGLGSRTPLRRSWRPGRRSSRLRSRTPLRLGCGPGRRSGAAGASADHRPPPISTRPNPTASPTA